MGRGVGGGREQREGVGREQREGGGENNGGGGGGERDRDKQTDRELEGLTDCLTTPYFSKVSISVERPTDTPAVATVLRGMKTFTLTCYDDRTSTNTAQNNNNNNNDNNNNNTPKQEQRLQRKGK